MSIITVENLTFKEILSYPKIEIEQETTFVCGNSGAGKSTLLKLLNGVTPKSGGKIYFNGKNIDDTDPIELRKKVLLCGQSVYLFDKSISENFDEYYSYREMPFLNDEEKMKFLHICCADFPLDTVCTSMSGGERQRIYIAICMSFMPQVLMLDEPTAALDTKNANDLVKNIKLFCTENSISLIIVCHNDAIAEHFADKIITLDGRIAI
ncbi:MAG: ABC transporter ATP-binding protein [Oscillospiraceae bacterium]